MTEVKRIIINSKCNKCAGSQTIFEISTSLDKKFLQTFIDNNFNTVGSYTNSGILYIENHDLIATGAFGSNRIQIKCKRNGCDASIDKLENILKTL